MDQLLYMAKSLEKCINVRVSLLLMSSAPKSICPVEGGTKKPTPAPEFPARGRKKNKCGEFFCPGNLLAVWRETGAVTFLSVDRRMTFIECVGGKFIGASGL